MVVCAWAITLRSSAPTQLGRRAGFKTITYCYSTTHLPAADNPLQIGFVALLLLELVAGQGILNLLGVTVGQGLGFEF